MHAPDPANTVDDRTDPLLWLAVLLPPAAWALDQLISYALIKPICHGGSATLLTLVSIGALAMVVTGGGVAWSVFGRVRGADSDGGTPRDRSAFMALVALGFNVLIGLLILTAATSHFLLNPCE